VKSNILKGVFMKKSLFHLLVMGVVVIAIDRAGATPTIDPSERPMPFQKTICESLLTNKELALKCDKYEFSECVITTKRDLPKDKLVTQEEFEKTVNETCN
jgi:hypothetical protein